MGLGLSYLCNISRIYSRVSLKLNGETVTSMGGTNNTSATNSIILPLNRGDRVHIELQRGQLIELNKSYRHAR